MLHQRRLGHTDLIVSSLSLGTVSLGAAYGISPDHAGMPPPTFEESARLLHQALDQGINFIDTARAYGSSEAVIGRALKMRRREICIATKINALDAAGQPLRGDDLRRRAEESLLISLEQLQTDYVDLLMLHSAPPALLADGEALAALRAIQARGLARYIGASTYGAEAAQMAMAQGVDALQVAYNVLDQRMAAQVFPLAVQRGVGIIVRSVYLKGALTERAEDLPGHLEPLKQLSRQYRQVTASFDLPPADAALRFALSHPHISTVLVGVRTSAELTQAVQAAQQGPLSPETYDQFAALRCDDPALVDPTTWGIP